MEHPEIKIENSVAPPKRSGKHPYYQVLYEMAVGDSFALPLEFKKQIAAAVAWCKKSTGKNFTYRASKTEVRVWRIENDRKEQ
jgi:hypothetical protein